MQKVAVTPVRHDFEKKLHTPPTLDRDGFTPTRRKLLRSLSGKVFKRTPDLASQQNGIFESQSFKYPTTPIKLIERNDVPRPLNLNSALTPPPTVKKLNKNVLKSPLNSIENPDSELNVLLSPIEIVGKKSQTLHSSRSIKDSRSGFGGIILDAFEDEYYLNGRTSPLSKYSSNKSLEKSRLISSSKKFVDQHCSMCQESIGSTFVGEKNIELLCSHIAHYDCFYILCHNYHLDGKIPNCKICHEPAEPVNEEVLQGIVSKYLSAPILEEEGEIKVEEQWLDSKVDKQKFSQFASSTPKEQMIKTADLTPNGFQMPGFSLSDDIVDGSIPLTCYSATDNKMSLDEEFIPLPMIEDYADTPTSNDPSLRNLNIEMNYNDTESSLEITVKAPDSPSEAKRIECKQKIMEREAIQKSVEEYISQKLKVTEDVGHLLMFDKTIYSTNGETWSENIIIFYFTKTLMLYNTENNEIIGKIPVGQVNKVNRLNNRVMILDLKNRTLPEIYLSMPFTRNDGDIISKWKHYIETPIHEYDKVPFKFLTNTAFDILPSKLEEEVKTISLELTEEKPWEVINDKAKLQLVLCLNLFTDSDVEEHRKKLKAMITDTLASLSEDDQFGLVLLGINGNGEVGEHGKFIGIINKSWEGWEEILDQLEVVDHQVFKDRDTLMKKTLEPCYKLFSTVCYQEDKEDTNGCIREIIILDDQKVTTSKDRMVRKYKKSLIKTYGCHFNIIGKENNCKTINETIDELHTKLFQNISIRLSNDKTVMFDHMSNNEIKTLSLKYPDHNETETVVISWFDNKKRAKRQYKTTIKLTNVPSTHNSNIIKLPTAPSSPDSKSDQF